MEFKFQRKRIDKIPEAKLLAELEKAAKYFNYIEFGHREFNEVAAILANGTNRDYSEPVIPEIFYLPAGRQVGDPGRCL